MTTFKSRVDQLAQDEIMFEAAGVQYVKRDGQLWMTGDNIWYDEVIPSVAEYVESLKNTIKAAEEWDENGDDEQLQADVERIREEISDYALEDE